MQNKKFKENVFQNVICKMLLSTEQNYHFADIFKLISSMKMFIFWYKFQRTLFLKSPILKNSTSVQVMAWYLWDTMPLLESLLTKISDAIWHH